MSAPIPKNVIEGRSTAFRSEGHTWVTKLLGVVLHFRPQSTITSTIQQVWLKPYVGGLRKCLCPPTFSQLPICSHPVCTEKQGSCHTLPPSDVRAAGGQELIFILATPLKSSDEIFPRTGCGVLLCLSPTLERVQNTALLPWSSTIRRLSIISLPINKRLGHQEI